MRNIHFADDLERNVADALELANIEYVHESENKAQVLDFYLPGVNVYIEVKQYHTDRVAKQLAAQDNVILIQGKKALAFFTQNFKR